MRHLADEQHSVIGGGGLSRRAGDDVGEGQQELGVRLVEIAQVARMDAEHAEGSPVTSRDGHRHPAAHAVIVQ